MSKNQWSALLAAVGAGLLAASAAFPKYAVIMQFAGTFLGGAAVPRAGKEAP